MIDSIADSAEFELGDAFQALRRGITRARGFAIFVCVCNSKHTRQKIIDNLFATLPGAECVTIDIQDVGEDLLGYLTMHKRAQSNGPQMLIGINHFFEDNAKASDWFGHLNLSRGEWPEKVPQATIFWVDKKWLGTLLSSAPDFFDWRSDTIEFPEISEKHALILGSREWHTGVDPRLDVEDQTKRRKELQARIKSLSHSTHPKDVKAQLDWWDELAELALVSGELDEALRIRTEEQLPVYERLGEVRELRSRAVR